jgi:hypothetical protein
LSWLKLLEKAEEKMIPRSRDEAKTKDPYHEWTKRAEIWVALCAVVVVAVARKGDAVVVVVVAVSA